VIRIRSLRTRLSLAAAGLVIVALAIVYAIVVPSLEHNLTDQKLDQLTRAVRSVQDSPRGGLLLEEQIRAAAETTKARVVVFEPVGPTAFPLDVAFDTATRSSPSSIVNDPIVARVVGSQAAERGVVSRRGERYAEVAVPSRGARILLFSAPMEDTLASVRLVQRRVLLAGAVALVVAMLLGASAASVFSARLRRLERAAERIAGGTLDEPVVDRGSDEVGQLAAAFEHMRRQLAQLDDARRAFVANASHELRTPIFSLSGFLELLTSEDLNDRDRDEFLRSMREQVERLSLLAGELLDLSRLDAGQLRVGRDPVDLTAVGDLLANEFRPVAAASGHALEVAATGPRVALADGERVLQIGRALVLNAIRHTPAGTTVRLAVDSSDTAVTLAVEDDGPGIAPEHHEQVFQRFYRVDGTRASGSGLGLAIARELAELMEGRLELESRPGRTVFRLELPAAAGLRRSTARDGVRPEPTGAR